MSVINSYISANFTMGSETIATLPKKPGKFSNYLNDLWAPAWNVVIILSRYSPINFDAVIYGYAFRNHWLWINGLKLYTFLENGLIYYGSFIIWKDYNCLGWLTINSYVSGVLSNSFT